MSIEYVDVENGTAGGAGSSEGTGPRMSEDEQNTAKPDIEELRAEIRQTRAELGETVQALAARADVKARARDSVDQAKEQARQRAAGAVARLRQAVGTGADNVRASRTSGFPISLMIAGAAALAGVILIVRGRRR